MGEPHRGDMQGQERGLMEGGSQEGAKLNIHSRVGVVGLTQSFHAFHVGVFAESCLHLT